jgi:putative endonuclease
MNPVRDNQMLYTYILQSKKDNKWYTGSTNDLRKRFKEHNSNKVYSTKGRSPFDIIYYEACINEQDARQREKYLKSGMGKRYLKNRMKRFLSLMG